MYNNLVSYKQLDYETFFAEGYSALLCGTLIAHIVDEVNKKTSSICLFEVCPIIKKEPDARSTDYSIFRIYNKKTYVMIEVKLDVPTKVIGATRDNIAQLLLEAM